MGVSTKSLHWSFGGAISVGVTRTEGPKDGESDLAPVTCTDDSEVDCEKERVACNGGSISGSAIKHSVSVGPDIGSCCVGKLGSLM